MRRFKAGKAAPSRHRERTAGNERAKLRRGNFTREGSQVSVQGVHKQEGAWEGEWDREYRETM